MNPFIFAKVFADFQGAFYKKPLEAGFGATTQHLIKFLPNRNVDFSYNEPSFCMGDEKTSSGLSCRDPFILVCNGKYYLYKNENNKIVCLVGDDLEHWSKPVVVFDPPKDFHGIKDIFWAPECHFYKENFYIFTSVYSSIFMQKGETSRLPLSHSASPRMDLVA